MFWCLAWEGVIVHCGVYDTIAMQNTIMLAEAMQCCIRCLESAYIAYVCFFQTSSVALHCLNAHHVVLLVHNAKAQDLNSKQHLLMTCAFDTLGPLLTCMMCVAKPFWTPFFSYVETHRAQHMRCLILRPRCTASTPTLKIGHGRLQTLLVSSLYMARIHANWQHIFAMVLYHVTILCM